jgi:UDP-glucuronate decarboxylase
MRKRVLVAGGAGFLGSHVCERLLAEGHEVVCLDNLLTGRRCNVEPHRRNRRFSLVEHDITCPLAVEGRIDEVYNMACPASPAHYGRDPHYTVMISVLGVSNLLRLAREKGARLVQASTSEVYGDPLEHPQAETHNGNVNCTGPRACYDEGKRCAEALLFDAWRSGLPVKVARIFNTYGPRMQADDGRVVSNFVVQALKGEPLTVYGDGSQTRSFCYVDDLIDGLVRLMATPADFAGPVNLGNPEEVTVIDLARRIVRMTGGRGEIEMKPLPVDDPRRRRPDIARAKERLGWAPKTPLANGLSKTIADFRLRLAEDAPPRARRTRTRPPALAPAAVA